MDFFAAPFCDAASVGKDKNRETTKNLDLSTKLLTKDKLATLKKLKADVSSISSSIRSDERLSTQLINPIFLFK